MIVLTVLLNLYLLIKWLYIWKVCRYRWS